jgi:hypothetical protein
LVAARRDSNGRGRTSSLMTVEEFRKTLSDFSPPASVTPLICALWHDARRQWQQAHSVVQEIESREAAWVHAYLHRKEGDEANAAYWYRRASQPVARESLESEWERIVRALLS